jgi:hypothetical protein
MHRGYEGGYEGGYDAERHGHAAVRSRDEGLAPVADCRRQYDTDSKEPTPRVVYLPRPLTTTLNRAWRSIR